MNVESDMILMWTIFALSAAHLRNRLEAAELAQMGLLFVLMESMKNITVILLYMLNYTKRTEIERAVYWKV